MSIHNLKCHDLVLRINNRTHEFYYLQKQSYGSKKLRLMLGGNKTITEFIPEERMVEYLEEFLKLIPEAMKPPEVAQ